MKKFIIVLPFVLLISCSKVKENKQNALSHKDSIDIEEALMAIKNVTFNECYYKSKSNTFKRMGIKENNECYKNEFSRVSDLTGYFYVNNSSMSLYWVFEDKNRERLLDKWINKKEYIPFVHQPDFPDGSLDMVRALDFYNSKDMKNYIDSLRKVEIKEHLSNQK